LATGADDYLVEAVPGAGIAQHGSRITAPRGPERVATVLMIGDLWVTARRSAYRVQIPWISARPNSAWNS
jgi:hypothetical protein